MSEKHLISQGEKKSKPLANMVNIQLKRFDPCTTISIFKEE